MLESTVTVINLHSSKTVVISLEAPTLSKSHVHWYPSAHLLSKQETSIFSASTSTHDDRCIVIKEGNSSMCHHYLCKQKRVILVNSQKAFDFNCSHLESVGDCVSPIKVFNDLADINTCPCDDSTNSTGACCHVYDKWLSSCCSCFANNVLCVWESYDQQHCWLLSC